MSGYMVATGDLEQSIYHLLDNRGALDFPREVQDTVALMVESYNATQGEALIDCMIEAFRQRLDDYSVIDIIVAQFVDLVESFAESIGTHLHLVYDQVNETLYVNVKPTRINPAVKLKEEYQNAQAQGDFYPERLRRAFDELLSSSL